MVMVVGYLKDLGGKAPFAMAEPWRGKAVAEAVKKSFGRLFGAEVHPNFLSKKHPHVVWVIFFAFYVSTKIF
jgi:hypothetical protein